MWTLIGRFGMSLFLNEDSSFFFMKFFVKVTDPLMSWFRPITPAFLVQRLRPLYVAWFIYMIRFYVIPLSLGYGVMGVLSLPLESEISLAIYDLLDLLTTKVDLTNLMLVLSILLSQPLLIRSLDYRLEC